ncbi:uncharacterized protein [Triticum aestivum]|uniref:uncharacterized protein isoform X3 n=1 Tax=Triticum aestivum TaxID=4565 RepID=UPI001D01A272|nr:uncharacterized protein LOC123165717 isoform X3 [Triticum aestivum]XP_044439357.1 uncharacterized protein LOC123165717 isoform X3 [Triticum aestivum]
MGTRSSITVVLEMFVATHQFLKLKTGKDPRISGAWLHTHKLHRGTDEEQICSQRTADHWEDFDKAMKNAHGENWEEEHPDLDGQIMYEAAGRMPHGRLGIANELFSKPEKAKFKSKRAMASQPVQSAKEERLERENKHLKQEIKRLRGIELVVQSLAEKGGVDFDGIMQSAADDLADFKGDEVMCLNTKPKREWEAGLEAVRVMEMMMKMTTMAMGDMITMARVICMVMSTMITMAMGNMMTTEMRMTMAMAVAMMMIGYKSLMIFKSCQNVVMLDI